MKKWIASLALIIGAQIANAQLGTFKLDEAMLLGGQFSVVGGLSVPFKDFADKSFKLESGYANIGSTIKVGFSYEVAPFIGIVLQYNNFVHPFDKGDFISDFKAARTDVTLTSFETENWRLGGMMLGFLYPLKMYRTTIDSYVGATLLHGVYPKNTIAFIEKQTMAPFQFLQDEVSGNNVGFQAGIKFRYGLFDKKFSRVKLKNLLLIIAVDYLYTEIVYKDIIILEELRSLAFSVPDYTQQYQLINLSVGLGLQFD